MPVPGHDFRELRRGVAGAADAQLLRVVCMVDALGSRGASDALIEPVRGRLRAMNPPRPLRFSRLLFMPLDPLVVPQPAWRPGSLSVPRGAIEVLSGAIRLAMTSDAEGSSRLDAIEATIATATTADLAAARSAGILLWPQAARVLRQLSSSACVASAGCLASWIEAGLPADELAPLTLSLVPILEHALHLFDHDHGGTTLDAEAAALLQAAALRCGVQAGGLMMALLLNRVPACAAELMKVAQAGGMPRQAATLAADSALAWLEKEAGDKTFGIGEAAPGELRRLSALLEALGELTGDAARKRRLGEARATLLASALQRLEISVEERLGAVPPDRPCQPAAETALVSEMEASARTLKRFETETRRLGAGSRLDDIVVQACRKVSATAWLGPMDQARLVEIIAGPQAALRLLAGGPHVDPAGPGSGPPA